MSAKRRIKRALLILIFILISLPIIGYLWLSTSQPKLNGKSTLPGLTSSVSIIRDKQGIPVIEAGSRADAARALGFIHGQERFFQMDLQRRNSAGELSALFGEAALKRDKQIRLHQFRKRAALSVSQAPPEQAEIYKAYTDGVNQGLAQLGSAPFEYTILGQSPQPWQEEDTLLTVFSMYLDLQEHNGMGERSISLLKSHLPDDIFAFLRPKGGQWDAPIDGSIQKMSPLPANPWPVSEANHGQLANVGQVLNDMEPEDFMPGSNNWAVSGNLTPYQSGMLADDMHLGIRVPILWYRAHIKWHDNGEAHQLVGVTLPGAPILVVGSNTHVAWGFTNSYGDWSDVIRLRTNEEQTQYLTPDGYKAFNVEKESILVADEQSTELEVKSTIWGPVIGKDEQGNLLAYRWVAHDNTATNLNFLALEKARTVHDAFDIAPTLGMPAQNMVAADSQGNVGWTITNSIPVRSGYDGHYISDWSDGTQAWTGKLAAKDYPRIINPEHQRIWTGNSRVVGGEMYQHIGDGGYALGARTKQIRDGLFAKSHFTEKDLLNIQLDSRAIFLSRWHMTMLEDVLPVSTHPEKSRIIEELNTWSYAANKDDLGYLLVRQFRLKTKDLVFNHLVAQLKEKDESFRFKSAQRYVEEALFTMISERPAHLLPPGYDSWDALLQKALTDSLKELNDEFGDWKTMTWGKFNAVAIQHPLSRFVPLLGMLTDMPKAPQSGDTFMPRVSGPAFGASQRIVVAPGHENNAILHMPTSQAAHPLSPYYGAGHTDWLNGKASPLLPGKGEYHLTLSPE